MFLNEDIHGAILAIMESMRLQGTSLEQAQELRKRIQCIRTLFIG